MDEQRYMSLLLQIYLKEYSVIFPLEMNSASQF